MGASPTSAPQRRSQLRVVPGRIAQASAGVASSAPPSALRGRGRGWRSSPRKGGHRASGTGRRRRRRGAPRGGRRRSRRGYVVLSAASGLSGSRRTRARDQVEPALEVIGRRRGHGPGLDRDRRPDVLVDREEAAAAERATADGDPDRGVSGRAIEAVARRTRRCRPAGRGRVSGSGIPRPGRGPMEPGEVLVELRRRGRLARGASRRRRRRAGSPGRRPRGAGRRPAGCSPSSQSGAGSPSGRRATSRPSIAPSGPRAFATVSSHSSAGSLRQVIPPPTWSVSRCAIRDEGPDQDARLHRAIGTDPAGRAGVRAAADRLEALQDLHRPDLRRAGDRAAGERRREEVEGSDAGASRPVTGTRGAGRPRSARGGTDAGPGPMPARRPARDRCAGRPRSSRSRPGPWPTRGARGRVADRSADRGPEAGCP